MYKYRSRPVLEQLRDVDGCLKWITLYSDSELDWWVEELKKLNTKEMILLMSGCQVKGFRITIVEELD